MSVEDKKPVLGFQDALKSVLRVSKTDLKRLVEADNRARAGKPRRGPKPRTGVRSVTHSSDVSR